MAVPLAHAGELEATAKHLEFLVEEPSLEAFLRVALPRMIPSSCSFNIHAYQGKPDLLRKLHQRLRGYRRWIPPSYRIVVLVDRDDQNCHIPRRVGYRDPDAIKGGTWEAFERIMKKHGYFTTGLRKTEAAEAIAAHIDPDRNQSGSFAVFRNVVAEATTP